MNLSYPATTQELLDKNPGTYPDAIRREIRRRALVGQIREIQGFWCAVPPPEDEPERQSAARDKPLHPCKVCGDLSKNAVYCSLDHANIGKREAARAKYPLCRRATCGQRVKKLRSIYCSLHCKNEDQRVPRLHKIRYGGYYHSRRMRELAND